MNRSTLDGLSKIADTRDIASQDFEFDAVFEDGVVKSKSSSVRTHTINSAARQSIPSDEVKPSDFSYSYYGSESTNAKVLRTRSGLVKGKHVRVKSGSAVKRSN